MAKILVVDDSMMMRELIKAPLMVAGHEVLGVVPNSLSDVLNEIKAFRPNLLITDYMMPHFNGEALVRAIRATPALGDLPILVLTAHRDADIVQRMSLHGVSGYLFKGLGMQELLDRVAAILTV
jgi:DNA-binding response OmpR family regulator